MSNSIDCIDFKMFLRSNACAACSKWVALVSLKEIENENKRDPTSLFHRIKHNETGNRTGGLWNQKANSAQTLAKWYFQTQLSRSR